MPQSNYDPCDAKDAFKRQGLVLLALSATLLGATALMAAIFGAILLLRFLADNYPGFKAALLTVGNLPAFVPAAGIALIILAGSPSTPWRRGPAG